MRNAVGRGEGDRDIAAAVAAERSHAPERDHSALGHAPELPLGKRDIRCQDHDDGAAVFHVGDVGLACVVMLTTDHKVAGRSEV